MHKEMRRRLIKAAGMEMTVPYSELASLANLNMDNPDDRNQMGALLGEISEYEHDDGRPLLSVLVVHKEGDEMPGAGFFELASELGVFDGQDRDKFFIDELNRVFAQWKPKAGGL